MNTRRVITVAWFVICLLALVASAVAQAKPVPVPTTPKPLKYDNLGGVQYCEVWLFVPQPDKITFVDYYNTSDFNNATNKMDTCPADMWAKINPEEVKAQYQDVATCSRMGHAAGPWTGSTFQSDRWWTSMG